MDAEVSSEHLRALLFKLQAMNDTDENPDQVKTAWQKANDKAKELARKAHEALNPLRHKESSASDPYRSRT